MSTSRSRTDERVAMSSPPDAGERRPAPIGEDARERLLAAMPVAERRMRLAGVLTAVLEGGDGPPVVLLHGAGEFAATWLRIIPKLATTHRVVAPDLPGHGASEVSKSSLDADRVLAWLGELIEATCASPPALVGHLLGGAIAARFASTHREGLSRLVLVDSLGLCRFEPAPEFGHALSEFLAEPSERTRDELFRLRMVDLDGLREQMGAGWAPLEAYALDRARSPGVAAALHTLMPELGAPAIAPAELARIAVPTSLIWGRHDLAAPLRVAEAASARHGWPLHVIENAADDPAVEQPEAFLEALSAALAGPDPQSERRKPSGGFRSALGSRGTSSDGP